MINATKLFLFLLAACSTMGCLQGQNSCATLIRQAKQAIRTGNTSIAIDKINDLDICDFDDSLLPEIEQLRTTLIDTLNRQKERLENTLKELEIKREETETALERERAAKKELDARILELKIKQREADSLRILAENAKAINQRIVDQLYFYAGRYATSYNGTYYGFIDTEGDVVIPAIFSEASPFDPQTGFALVKKPGDKNQYLLDTLENTFKYANSYAAAYFGNGFDIVDISYDNRQSKVIPIYKSDPISVTLRDTELKKIPPGKLKRWTRLEHFEIIDHKLVELTEDISTCTKLKTLSLPTTVLIEPIYTTTWIFGFNFNPFKKVYLKLPRGLSSLTLLETLNLSGCRLKSVTAEVYGLPQLRELNLSNTEINDFSPNDDQLHNLETLDLSGNQFKEVPEALFRMQQLRHLDISNNPCSKNAESIARLKAALPDCQINI